MVDSTGNIAVLQMGEPNPAKNAALAGVVLGVGGYGEYIQEIYGIRNGIHGLLEEDFIDLQEEQRPTMEELRSVGAPGLGASVFAWAPASSPELLQTQMDKAFQVLEAHNIRYLIAIGGREAQEAVLQLHAEAMKRGYDLRANSVPVADSNELPQTDHCPGYGTAAKRAIAAMRALESDLLARKPGEVPCCVVETKGWFTGWDALAAAVGLRSGEIPCLAVIPERPVSLEALVQKVEDKIREKGCCVVVVPDGARGPDGQAWAKSGFGWDYLGQPVGGSAGETVAEAAAARLQAYVSRVRLPALLRWDAGPASEKDLQEAYQCGEVVVQGSIHRQSGLMVKIQRPVLRPYRTFFLLHPIGEVLADWKRVPEEWYDSENMVPRDLFWDYLEPLLQGEVWMRFEKGVPAIPRLDAYPVPRKVDPTASAAS